MITGRHLRDLCATSARRFADVPSASEQLADL
jgi:hypothetical protein